MHSRHASPSSSPLEHLPDSSSITIREYRPGDEAAILSAFNEAYGKADPNFRARSLAEWRWRYVENPAGLRLWLAVDAEGDVLAQYAGLPQRGRLAGEPVVWTQCVDSMVRPGARGLSRRGLFVETGEGFDRAYAGRVGDADPWMWGFPVPAARRIGERFLGYRALRAQTALVREPGAGELLAGSDVAVEVPDFDDSFDAFFGRRGGEYGAIAERTAETLSWRYRARPGNRYRIGVVRGASRELVGFAVYREGVLDGRPSGILCDWLAGAHACGALLAWCAELAGELPLVAVMPPWCEEFRAFQDFGFRVRPTSLLLAGRSYDKRYDLRFWREHWYYTLGDSDLC